MDDSHILNVTCFSMSLLLRLNALIVAKVGLEPTCNQLRFRQGISLSRYIAIFISYYYFLYNHLPLPVLLGVCCYG